MRILITFAVDWEFRPWQRLGSFEKLPGSEGIYHTRIDGSDVRVALTGIGPSNSVRALRELKNPVPDVCITSGLAGGVRPDHRPGDILVAHRALDEASGTVLESDRKLLGVATDCGAKGVHQFVSAARVIRTAKEKQKLGRFADAVDMESFAIMKVMDAWGVPCVAIRSVADSAGMDVPCDFERAMDGSGNIRIVKVLRQVVSSPRQAWPLAQFGARSSRAAASLARYLDQYTGRLAGLKEKMDLGVQYISQ